MIKSIKKRCYEYDKIGVIHTTAATLQSTSELIKNTIDDAVIMNILDDTIPRYGYGNNVDYVKAKMDNLCENSCRYGRRRSSERMFHRRPPLRRKPIQY